MSKIRSNIRELLLELPPDAVKQANAKIPRDDKTGELKFFLSFNLSKTSQPFPFKTFQTHNFCYPQHTSRLLCPPVGGQNLYLPEPTAEGALMGSEPAPAQVSDRRPLELLSAHMRVTSTVNNVLGLPVVVVPYKRPFLLSYVLYESFR